MVSSTVHTARFSFPSSSEKIAPAFWDLRQILIVIDRSTRISYDERQGKDIKVGRTKEHIFPDHNHT